MYSPTLWNSFLDWYMVLHVHTYTCMVCHSDCSIAGGSPISQDDDTIRCINFVQEAMPIALARPFTEQVLPNGTKVRSICNNRL